MVLYLESYLAGNRGPHNGDAEDPLLQYLLTLPPPLIDAELRALCQHDNDETGLQLLQDVLHWLAEALGRCTHYQVLLAYVHRVLVIYDSVLIMHGQRYKEVLGDIRIAHERSATTLRDLVQSNACLLKILANIQ